MKSDVVSGPAAFYRVISPLYAHIPKSGAGAARQGGRFNRPGQEALYLSTDHNTALAEYQQDNPWLPPGTICTFFVDNLEVVDFSAGYNPSIWPPLWADFDIDWRAERTRPASILSFTTAHSFPTQGQARRSPYMTPTAS